MGGNNAHWQANNGGKGKGKKLILSSLGAPKAETSRSQKS
ncbi:hypothetical protein D082_01180 [Synechocystis sp. PCC 6714]|nr:hypothetical protein D082_01180 [Synechocystis sp. PCC 6714]